ncbi:MAG: ABC transporter ATP-binding protein [Planctomycetes bacterium]|nr:ABC transporter ATP-binding protein [Planctomycetota bacterium]
MNEAPAVEVCGLTKVFDSGEARVEALRGVDLSVRRGEFVSVMGPSGSGKSTLLHLVGGLDLPTEGTVRVEGTDLAMLKDDALTLLRRRRIGFVFQAFNLIDVLTAEENVALPLLIDGVAEAEAHRRAAEGLEQVGIGHRRGHWPGKLSGGEQQRVAIARALVTGPLLLLADEPTGNLDSATGDQVLALLRRLADEQRQTILMVTHDARQAARADRLVRLRDGRVVEVQDLGRARPAHKVLEEMSEIADEE